MKKKHFPRNGGQRLLLLTGAAIAVLMAGCTAGPHQLRLGDSGRFYAAGAIVASDSGRPVSFETLVSDLSRANVVYVGENHTDPEHHKVQRRILEALHKVDPDLSVGMEMFARPYQPILDSWSAGQLTEEQFLQKVHWYANWRYPYDLYRDLLEFAREHHLRVIALNIPFHIPPKIAVGGVASLLADDRHYLPARIDTSRADHRAYVRSVFDRHKVTGHKNFNDFYEAQCVWEDTMAESIARHCGAHAMLVIAGNGHIRNKFGIPDRAFDLTGVPFKTICPVSAGSRARLAWADYIWVTPADRGPAPGTGSPTGTGP